MRKPVKLVKNDGAFSTNCDCTFNVDFSNLQYVTPAQPDWAQTDESALDFIKNKQIAEQYRPITVNGEEFLNEDRSSGPLNVVGKGGVVIETEGNSLQFSVEAYVEGEAIDITDNDQGQKVISVDPTEITITELSQEEIFILDGGGANG